MSDKNQTKPPAPPRKFGTFGGVFTPSLLTIVGVIMFLRFSTVVGVAGCWHALLILLAATAITLVTGLSIASIATNMRVKGGGAYYLISRSLGPEFGGVIAVFFFVAQAVAVTLYVVGFTEAIFSAFPGLGLSFRMVATITNALVFVCVYIGAGWTIRLQYGILAVLLLAVLSFFIGAGMAFSPELLRANVDPAWTSDQSFFIIFALFFPAVTGIMAGVNMSGDLKDPSRSIPNGTFAAIGVSVLIYAAITILFAGSMSRADLLGPGFVMKDRAFSGALIYAGVIAATLSSALGSMMGAPRILQAFARDDIFHRLKWFARGSGRSGEPRRAIVLTFLIAQAGVFAGDLDVIAPIITMFFLMTYGTTNLACFFESISHNPSFRPTFRLNHWSVALLGTVACLGVMFLINALWASVAILLASLLYVLIVRAKILVKWGDLDSGLAYQRARNALLRLEIERYHPKNWRPSILTLSGGAYNRIHLADYAAWLTAENGILSIGQIIQGDFDDLLERQREAETILRKFIREEDIAAFPVVVIGENLVGAIQGLLQCHGLGGLRPNTLLVGWSRDPEKSKVFSDILGIAIRMRRSIIVVASKQEEERTLIPDGAINIWWTKDSHGALMLLLGYLLKNNADWRNRPLRILRPMPPKADIHNVAKEMQDMLAEARIEADLVIMPAESPIAAIREAMHPSAVLLAGFEPSEEDATLDLSQLQQTVDLPGDVLLVYNAGDVSLQA
ncbi:MAG: amino acid permease [Kiritimatiellae bacterium]|nr:amino acid permease [Kiritimatiellia bacterium]